ncbi:MAG: hypothetical protein KC983_10970, partial [Phycisphaerales bacterium]|nr:hypothetical protein [Phycisphaerales bacterium]
MTFYRSHRSIGVLCAILYVAGCSSDPSAGPMTGGSDRPVEVDGPPEGNQVRIDPLNPSTPIDARPAAIINGRSISFGDLRDALSEAAGGLVLEEAILDAQLRRALADAGELITDRDRNAERERLLATLSDDPDQAARLLS